MAGVITNVRVSLSGPGERTLVRPPDYPATNYVYIAVGEYDVEEEDGDENPPSNIVETYTWSWGSAIWVAGGGPNDASVTIKFDETNDDDITVTVTYTVTSDNGGGSDTKSIDVVVPKWDSYTPIECPDGITSPESGLVLGEASEVNCSVGTAIDKDRRVGASTSYPDDTFDGQDAYVWQGPSGGGWPDGNKGPSVRWVAPEGPVDDGEIRVTIDDDAVVPPNELGTRDDGALTVGPVTVDVVKVNITCQGLPEEDTDPATPDEIGPGAWMGVNDDDDAGGGAPPNGGNAIRDVDDPKPPVYPPLVYPDPDLELINLSISPMPDSGIATLVPPPGVEVYADRCKLPTVLVWNLAAPGGAFPAQLYAEATQAGGAGMTLRYVGSHAAEEDTVMIHTIRMDIDGDFDHNDAVDDDESGDISENYPPGLVVRLNSDDDDDSGNPDYGEAGSSDEDDLLRVRLRGYPPLTATGTAVLKATGTMGRIKVWSSSTKAAGSLLIDTTDGDVNTDKYEWTLGTSSTPLLKDVPEFVFIEGTAKSGSVTELAGLAYVYNRPSGALVHEDNLALTVVDVKVNVIIQGLPEEDDDPATDDELDPGAFICVNDNDNAGMFALGEPNGIPDLEDPTPLDVADPDLVEATISLTLDPDIIPAEVHITPPPGIRMWSDAKKTEEMFPGIMDLASIPGTAGAGTLRTKTVHLEGTSPGSGIFLIAANRAKSGKDKVTTNVIKVDLRIDSNNDGTVTDADDLVEDNAPGKLIHRNYDDDDEDGGVDRLSLSTSSVAGEDDLMPLELSVQGASPTGATVQLRLPGSAPLVKVFAAQTKGSADLLATGVATWGAGSLPSTLWVEGNSPGGAFTLVLEYIAGGRVIGSDTVLGAVVSTDLGKADGTEPSYGFDDGQMTSNPEINSRPNDSTTNPGGYGNEASEPWVSVKDGGGTTSLALTVTPPEYAGYVHIVSLAPSVATVAPLVASASPEQVTITGVTGDLTMVQCRLGSLTGAKGSHVNVAVYTEKIIQAKFVRLLQLTPPLFPSDTPMVFFEAYVRALLRQPVMMVTFNDRGDRTAAYDVNGNGVLDIYLDPVTIGGITYAAPGPEWDIAEPALPLPDSVWPHLAIRVKALTIHRIDTTTGGWVAEPMAGYAIPGIKFALVADTASAPARALAHELLHLAGLHDTGPCDPAPEPRNTWNLMHGKDKGGMFLGFFNVEILTPLSLQSHSPKQYESQWERCHF